MSQKDFCINCHGVVCDERHLVVLKGASEIFRFALELLLFGFFCLVMRSQSHCQQSWHAALDSCVQLWLLWLLWGNASYSQSPHAGEREGSGGAF